MRAKLQQIKQELRAADARAGCGHREWLKRVVLWLLPISRRTGKSTAVGAFPLAADSIMAVCTTPPESEVAGDLERSRSHL